MFSVCALLTLTLAPPPQPEGEFNLGIEWIQARNAIIYEMQQSQQQAAQDDDEGGGGGSRGGWGADPWGRRR